MALHTRSRTGCWTCRGAGYKCDEQKPFCARCTRLNITCKGYGVKLKWRVASASLERNERSSSGSGNPQLSTGTRTARTASTTSTSSISSGSALPDGSGWGSPHEWASEGALTPMVVIPDLVPDLFAGDKRLMHYWTEQLSCLISVTPRTRQPSPFQQHLTAMAYNTGALRSTVLSMAANHLAHVSGDSTLRICAYRHQRNAIRLLQQLIQSPIETAAEPALATVLMMQVSMRLFGEEDAEPHVANHLIGAKAMIEQKRGGLAAWSTSSSARFLLSLFAYHDILSSISRGSRPFLDHGVEFDAIEGVPSMQSIANVLQVVARISELQVTKSESSFASDPDSCSRHQIFGSELEKVLLDLDLSNSSIEGEVESSDVRLTAEAYRHAAFIYLYRVWLDIGAPNPKTLSHVQQCIACIEKVEVGSPLVSSHIWPLFTAGCEAVSFEHRQFVRDRFTAMFQSRKFPVMKRIIRDIEHVWACKDREEIVGGQDGMTKVDCIQVILRQRGREVDLA